MSSDVGAIVELLGQRGAAGYQQVVDLANDAPDSVVDLVLACAALPRASDAIDSVLELVDASQLPEVAAAAVRELRGGADPKASQAASLIAQLSLQSPASLAPHLDVLWDLSPNQGAYHADWPWRAATDPATLERLAGRLVGGDQDRLRAWNCLVESRTDRGWDEALGAIDRFVEDDPWTQTRLLVAGIERAGETIRRLFSPVPCHIEFPAGFLRPPSWSAVDGHIDYPTWRLAADEVGGGRFGGWAKERCKVCGERLHRLLRLDHQPDWVDAPSEIVTCLSCLGWSVEVLFFHHGGDDPTPAGWVVPKQEPEFPAGALPETDVVLKRTPARWLLQDWALSNGRQNLNRIGGEPSWIQTPAYPNCPDCSATMRFIMQLDSLDIDSGPWWLWGSGGILYVFWCGECAISATTSQCT